MRNHCITSEYDIPEALKHGDEKAFRTIFSEYFPALCLFANHFLKDKQLAESIVEDFFCDLWEDPTKLNARISLKAYLYKCIFNNCLKYLRHCRTVEKYSIERQKAYHEEMQTNTSSNAENELIRKELEGKISEAIDSLPPQCRKIFLLNKDENLSYQEIADHLTVSVSTVKTQMVRAFNKLRVELKDYFFFL